MTLSTNIMKRLFCILFLTTYTCLVWGQSVNEVHLKNGSIIKGTIVEMDPSSSVKIQTNDGSVFVYSMSEVDAIKKSEETTGGTSNYIAGSIRKIDRHKANYYWQDTRQKLTSDEYSSILNNELYDTYYSARKQFKSGRTLIFAGLAMATLAVINYSAYLNSYSAYSGTYYNESALSNYYLTSIAADGCFLFGFMLKGIGKGRMEWVKDSYNAGRSYSSTLNFSPSLMMTAQNDLGFGVSLNLSF